MSSVSAPPLDLGAAQLTKRTWGALIVLCGALFLDALDVSMIGVALPSIRADLGMSTSSLQWVVSGYVLGYGGFLLLGGRAADLLGRRRVFLAAVAGSAKAPEAGAAARGAAGRDGARDEAGVGSVIGDGRCRSGDRMTSTLCMRKQYLQAQLMYLQHSAGAARMPP